MRLYMLSTLFISALTLVGCDSFIIQGKVVQGSSGTMHFVSDDNTGLESLGLEGAKITVYRDPDSLGSIVAGTAVSDDQGRFVIKLDAFGAGWMLEQFRIVAQRQGYANVLWQQSLSAEHEQQRLLIIMGLGFAEPVSRDELWKQYEILHQPKKSKTNK